MGSDPHYEGYTSCGGLPATYPDGLAVNINDYPPYKTAGCMRACDFLVE